MPAAAAAPNSGLLEQHMAVRRSNYAQANPERWETSSGDSDHRHLGFEDVRCNINETL